jgi:hypothetical protein
LFKRSGLWPVPLEGCVLKDVGWMKMAYDEMQGIGAMATLESMDV